MLKTAHPLSLLQSPAAALAVGAMLGWLARELSQRPEQPLFQLTMALVLLASGSVSFLLYSLHLQSQSPRSTRGWAVEARACVTWLGCGLLMGLNLNSIT